MSAQSLRSNFNASAEESDARDTEQRTEAIATRAKLIATQIRADILVPITDEEFDALDRAGKTAALARMCHVESVRESFGEMLNDATLATTQRQLVGKHPTALYKFQRELHDKALDAYALQAATREIDEEIKANNN